MYSIKLKKTLKYFTGPYFHFSENREININLPKYVMWVLKITVQRSRLKYSTLPYVNYLGVCVVNTHLELSSMTYFSLFHSNQAYIVPQQWLFSMATNCRKWGAKIVEASLSLQFVFAFEIGMNPRDKRPTRPRFFGV